MTLDCLRTTVRNMSGSEKFYGFLPPHGRLLAAGEEMTFFGDLTTRVAHRWSTRCSDSYENTVDDTDLVIVKTPLVHLYDDTADVTKGLALAGGTLGSVDPCWGAYSSSSLG